MSLYRREPPTDPEFTASGDVLEWLPHPAERGQRACHAIRGDDGVWLVDPIDVPGLDDRLAEFGEVAGAVVCTNAHARDAGKLARRHGVSVHLAAGLDRAAGLVDGPAVRTGEERFDPAIDVRVANPLPGWHDAILRIDDALYVPELLGTAPQFTVGDERVGVSVIVRLAFPTEPFEDLAPDRLFFGHGRALTDDATAALRDAIRERRARFPRAILQHGPEQAASIVRNIVLG